MIDETPVDQAWGRSASSLETSLLHLLTLEGVALTPYHNCHRTHHKYYFFTPTLSPFIENYRQQVGCTDIEQTTTLVHQENRSTTIQLCHQYYKHHHQSASSSIGNILLAFANAERGSTDK